LKSTSLQSRPLKTRPTKIVGQFSSQSPLTKAFNDMLHLRNGSTLFVVDGRVEVVSDTVERGTQGGVESGSIAAWLVTAAKATGLDPQTYLADVLERIVSGRVKSHQLHELLVWNWKATRKERMAA
jgi:transposase